MSKTLVLVLMALMFTGCGKKERDAVDKSPPVFKKARMETLRLSVIPERYEAVGSVRAKTVNVLSSKVVGNVVAVLVREGERVQKGQRLIDVDDRDATAQLQKAQAGLQEARNALEEMEQNIQAAELAKVAAEANKTLTGATLKRYLALLERKSVSPQEYDEVLARNRVAESDADRSQKMVQSMQARRDQVLAKINQAKADVENARIYGDYSRITSPIAGMVTAKPAEVGALAAPGVPLITVESDAQYRFEATVEESQVSRIQVGTPAEVIINALGPDPIGCRVTEIMPALDPSSRTFVVKIDLPGQGVTKGNVRVLRSGLYGKARFTVGQKQVLLIPQKSVIRRGELESVFVVDPSLLARLRLIKTGSTQGDRVEVLSGLQPGERIIGEDAHTVMEGSRVEE